MLGLKITFTGLAVFLFATVTAPFVKDFANTHVKAFWMVLLILSPVVVLVGSIIQIWF